MSNPESGPTEPDQDKSASRESICLSPGRENMAETDLDGVEL